MKCAFVAQCEERYVLGELPRWQMSRVTRHVSRCVACRQRLAEYEATLDLLFDSVAPMPPPPHVRQAVLSRVEKMAEPGGAVKRGRPFRIEALRFRLAYSLVMTALAVLLLGALVFSQVQLQATQTQQAQTAHMLALSASPESITWPMYPPAGGYDSRGPHAMMYVLPGDDTYLVTATHLPAVASGEVYRAWYIEGGVLTFGSDIVPDARGDARVTFRDPDQSRGDITRCFITREKAGSPATAPTTPVLLEWQKA